MASKASSIQPREAASRVRRCAELANFRSWMGPIATRGKIVSGAKRCHPERSEGPQAPQILIVVILSEAKDLMLHHFNTAEPGPYRIFAVYSVNWPEAA